MYYEDGRFFARIAWSCVTELYNHCHEAQQFKGLPRKLIEMRIRELPFIPQYAIRYLVILKIQILQLRRLQSNEINDSHIIMIKI